MTKKGVHTYTQNPPLPLEATTPSTTRVLGRGPYLVRTSLLWAAPDTTRDDEGPGVGPDTGGDPGQDRTKIPGDPGKAHLYHRVPPDASDEGLL